MVVQGDWKKWTNEAHWATDGSGSIEIIGRMVSQIRQGFCRRGLQI